MKGEITSLLYRSGSHNIGSLCPMRLEEATSSLPRASPDPLYTSCNYFPKGCRKATPLCETPCKPRSGAAWGICRQPIVNVPRRGTSAYTWINKSRFAELCRTICASIPQLRRFHGLQWVSHRDVVSRHPLAMGYVSHTSYKYNYKFSHKLQIGLALLQA